MSGSRSRNPDAVGRSVGAIYVYSVGSPGRRTHVAVTFGVVDVHA